MVLTDEKKNDTIHVYPTGIAEKIPIIRHFLKKKKQKP